jgi:hypothetical protein
MNQIKLVIFLIISLSGENSINLNAQETVESISFTRFYNDKQLVIKLTKDTCFFTDNIDRNYYKTQKTYTIYEYRDWEDFKIKCALFIDKCKPVNNIPVLYPRTSKDTVVSELYIETPGKIYFYSWTYSNEVVKPYLKPIDYFNECFSDDEQLCKIYRRLLK